ncbi:MAG: RecQ family ATP-dependent DNA helicase [Stygiobacter sp.]|nr:MAG: DNA helicase II [Stygiobacter sp. GWC2_38_9]OGV05895.1 MAG: DNA helicase II [Stygiobacter sp. RIFOXYB2_FULL_37_11]OGV10692.1 MAG: DNA helicase II [Stygiobacter sp. RIFOXYA2_FULL_38_8]OGV14486.1 MAG: DNA helicase II [Stygiobacter sp. RIFOXYC2_FULL_38_25]OGV82246.1 MAG: DNA helicase II [Stygiobacter sp. GWF2_38_21]RJQ57595.1 MAG: RecQ family ATP-dependent DNA helicase [Stygiobacter sp.]
MNRVEAEKKLKTIFGFENFYDEQWNTIKLLFEGKRVLLIEKTGYGKSLCFQFPATQCSGVTVVFSPLIALMRDQVRSLNEKGIAAKFINSEQTQEENSATIQDAIQGKVKILYIAPERQENQEWIDATRKMNLAMIVIDEAHTISVWGHDFRPAFRRIINLVQLLPKNLPVLATTATATKRVEKDIEKQISGDIVTIRGNLMRENLHLFVIDVKSEDDKLVWLGDNIAKLQGSGIIYTGTRVNTEIYSRWLNFININSVEYNAGLDGDSRKEIEKGLMSNKWKCVISTNALGMGIDKPDIRFIIHTQIPASPIHYYQEIGRAGRDGKPTYIILFFNSTLLKNNIFEDAQLPIAFIEGGRPSIQKYQSIIDALKTQPLGERELIKVTNMKQTQIRVIKADLIEQGIVKEVVYGRSKKYDYQFNAPRLDTKTFQELREMKLKELDSMIEYIFTEKSRMQFLCEYLGDSYNKIFSNCDNTNHKKIIFVQNKEVSEKLSKFRETYFPELIVESNDSNIVNGVASSYYGASSVGAAIHKSKYENGGDFPDFLLKLTLKAFRNKYSQQKFDYVCYVPPTESGDLVKNFAEKISIVLKIPITHKLKKISVTKPQKIFQNSYLKKDNVKGAFRYENPSEIKSKVILLLDDIFDSGATIKEIGSLFTSYGAKTIAPIVMARTVGGDI